MKECGVGYTEPSVPVTRQSTSTQTSNSTLKKAEGEGTFFLWVHRDEEVRIDSTDLRFLDV